MFRGTIPDKAEAVIPGDVIFDSVSLDGDNKLDWFALTSDGMIDASGTSQGEWVVAIGDTMPLVVRFEPNKAFYVGGPDSAVAERIFFGFGMEPDEPYHFPLTKAAKQVYLGEICRAVGIPQLKAVFDKPYHYDIIFLKDLSNTKDDYTINFLANQGFNVTPFWGGPDYDDVNTWSDDTLAILDNADLVISGRSVNSGKFGDSIERVVWNNIAAPMMYNSPYHVRNTRNHLFNSGSAVIVQPEPAEAAIPGDIIFADVTLTGDAMDWFVTESNGIQVTTDDSQGTLVLSLNDSVPLIVRFDANKAFYAGGPDSAIAERVYFGFGIEETEARHFPLTRDAKQVFLAEVSRILGITAPQAIYSASDYTIQFLNNPNDRDATQKAWLADQGFTVNSWYGTGTISEWTADTIDILNNADIIIVGRSVGSGESADSADKAVWNSLTAPLIFNSPWACRNTRNNMFNSTATSNIADGTDTEADAIIPDDPVLEFADITDGKMDWFVNNGDIITDNSGTNQGTWVVAQADTVPFLVRFEPNKAFYTGGPDSAVADRVYFGFGMEGAENYFPMHQNAQAVYFAEILRLLGAPITEPVYYNTDRTLSYLATSIGTLAPEFDSDTRAYTVALDDSASSIEIYATASAGDVSSIEGAGVIALTPWTDETLYVVCTSQIGQRASYAITVEQPDEPVEPAVEDLSASNIMVYPNPFSSKITIRSEEEIAEVTVLDLRGAIVMNNSVNNSTVELDLGTLKSGTYLIKVQTTSGVSVSRIIKQ
jgi:hypothetical protein